MSRHSGRVGKGAGLSIFIAATTSAGGVRAEQSCRSHIGRKLASRLPECSASAFGEVSRVQLRFAASADALQSDRAEQRTCGVEDFAYNPIILFSSIVLLVDFSYSGVVYLSLRFVIACSSSLIVVCYFG